VRLLLDTHTLIWAVDDTARLGAAAARELRSLGNQLLLGAGTIWELSIKVGLGKLKLSAPFRPWVEAAVADLGLVVLPVTVEYADAQARLPHHHGDPFDRLLVAQALSEGIGVVSGDTVLDRYGVTRVWA
jgi:PIN domain nuclease of toxin-antitoxin system